ncbi:MAG: flagellar assembly protein FliX [Caulobacteraceae bacterium]|nr:flagellar assembly protein FliX [Caulobacteraceae bacterium]
MKIGSTTSTSATGGARGARTAAGGGGFSLSVGAAEEASATHGASGVSAVGSIEALMALQAVEGPMERRRRAVRRGNRLLDLLGDIKLGLLDGALPAASLERLSQAVREERAGVDHPELDGVLDEIDTRAAVELAKLDVARRGATAA